MKYILLFSFLLTAGLASSQDLPAYVIYDSTGKKVPFSKMADKLSEGEVVFFGELHNDPVMHWLQLELTSYLLKKKGENLVLGAEMFEADDQIIMDEYLQGKMTRNSFSAETKLWPNYNTDYQPLVELAKENNLRFIATNVPRRYANLVYKEGVEALENLSPQSASLMAPLPFPYDSTVRCYSDMKLMSQGHGGDNLPKSQALKDATMAHFIKNNRGDKDLFLHYNGTYHSDRQEGIAWYLKKENPKLKIFNISAVSADDPQLFNEEWKGLGDFILVTDQQMTKTH